MKQNILSSNHYSGDHVAYRHHNWGLGGHVVDIYIEERLAVETDSYPLQYQTHIIKAIPFNFAAMLSTTGLLVAGLVGIAYATPTPTLKERSTETCEQYGEITTGSYIIYNVSQSIEEDEVEQN